MYTINLQIEKSKLKDLIIAVIIFLSKIIIMQK